MKLKFRRTAGAVALGLSVAIMLAACAAEETNDEPQFVDNPLTVSEAAGLYLEAVCPVNEAWDRADLALDQLRIAVRRGDTEAPWFEDAMRDLASVSKVGAGSLEASGEEWPDAAADEIERVQKTLDTDAEQAAKVASLSPAEALKYEWQGADEIEQAAAEARAVLQLPDEPGLACEKWVEEKAEAIRLGKLSREARERAGQGVPFGY